MVRTRFAPSPTGSLHVGNARIAVLNWLFTRQQRGQFALRVEDTDAARNVEGAEHQLMEDLTWLGLDWDEGPTLAGTARGGHGPYRQTERLSLYREYAEKLLASGHVFRCYCTDAELEAARSVALARGEQPHYPGTCRRASAAQRSAWEAEGRRAALRFEVKPDEDIVVRDIVYGDVHVRSDDIGDFIVLRSDGWPTYNFAVVVDDVLMEITHVIRGVGHLSNTPRQIVLYQALAHEPPAFAHIPMVLGADRQKLSKRHGAQALADYRREGYHPDALVNYLSLLGWSSPSGEEFLSREQLIAEISLERIGNADVIFDPVKLSWLSAKHIDAMPIDALVAAVQPFVDRDRFPLSDVHLAIAVAATRTHLTKFADINEQLAAFYPDREPAPSPAPAVVRAAREKLIEVAAWDDDAQLGQAIKNAGHAAGAKGKALYEPLRLALTGREHGPPFTAVLRVQGRERVLERLRVAAGDAE
ncbi:MAG TPA: glutamate--tRNA ligase [Longimicrobiales bacterium]|nr:glutamate--tRNA ligase [Longimicrobiales bacterium]